MSAPGAPTIGGFNEFITTVMQVPAAALPPGSPVIQWSFDFAYDWVNTGLAGVPSQSGGWSMYTRAVYNLAADTLINWAQDPDAEPIYKDDLKYWAWLRKTYGVLNFVAGVVNSTSDEGTSASYQIPEQFKEMTIANLGNLKTPYGRAYLGIAGSWGTLWGLS